MRSIVAALQYPSTKRGVVMFITGLVMMYQGITGGATGDLSGLEAQIVTLVEKGFSYLGIGLTIVGMLGWFPDTPKTKDRLSDETAIQMDRNSRDSDPSERMRNESMSPDRQFPAESDSSLSAREPKDTGWNG